MAIKTSCTALHLDRRGFAWNIEDIKDTAQSRINRHDFQLTTRHPTDVDILIKIQRARIAREMRRSCRLVVENTNVCVAGEISSAFNRLVTKAFSLDRSSGIRPPSSAALSCVKRSRGGCSQ